MAVPAQTEAIAMGLHLTGNDDRMKKRAEDDGVNHGPDAETRAHRGHSHNDGDRGDGGRQRWPGKAVKTVQHCRAVGGDAAGQHHGQQGVEQMLGQHQLGGSKVRGQQRKDGWSHGRHGHRKTNQQTADPEHGA
jgi:hypothetical protein